jgi:hypothetical protein
MQSAGFDFFFAGELDETVEAVEVEAFEVGTAAKKDKILDCRRAFWIAFAMTAFDELEWGHNFGGSSLLAKSSSSSFDLLRSSSSWPLTDMLLAFGVCAMPSEVEIKGVSLLKIAGFCGTPKHSPWSASSGELDTLRVP